MAAMFYSLLLLSAVSSSCRAEEPGNQASLGELESAVANAGTWRDQSAMVKGQLDKLEGLIGVSILHAALNNRF